MDLKLDSTRGGSTVVNSDNRETQCDTNSSSDHSLRVRLKGVIGAGRIMNPITASTMSHD